jgi:hypothetical protein
MYGRGEVMEWPWSMLFSALTISGFGNSLHSNNEQYIGLHSPIVVPSFSYRSAQEIIKRLCGSY